MILQDMVNFKVSCPLRSLRAALVVCLVASGCGPRVYYRDGVVHTPHTEYRLGEPSGSWTMVKDFGGDVAFLDEQTGAVILANATCEDFEDAPLKVLTNHLLIGFTDREKLDAMTFVLDGREALATTWEAKLDGVPVKLHLVVMKKNYCIYDLSYTAPLSTYDTSFFAFQDMIATFEVVP